MLRYKILGCACFAAAYAEFFFALLCAASFVLWLTLTTTGVALVVSGTLFLRIKKTN